jgi:hypothetical protein
MTHAFASRPAPIATGSFVHAIRSLHPVALPLFVAIVVFSTVSMANVPVARWLDSSPEQALQLRELEPAAEAAAGMLPGAGEGAVKARVRTRCAACGVVEAIRRIEPAGNLPAAYEFTVRLRDGSIRLSRDASQSKWLAGDRIMLVGEAGHALGRITSP